jgi:hypothetical protein
LDYRSLLPEKIAPGATLQPEYGSRAGRGTLNVVKERPTGKEKCRDTIIDRIQDWTAKPEAVGVQPLVPGVSLSHKLRFPRQRRYGAGQFRNKQKGDTTSQNGAGSLPVRLAGSVEFGLKTLQGRDRVAATASYDSDPGRA